MLQDADAQTLRAGLILEAEQVQVRSHAARQFEKVTAVLLPYVPVACHHLWLK